MALKKKKTPFTNEQWNIFNKCRSMLIHKKHSGGGLTKLQQMTLDAMQEGAWEYVDFVAPLPPVGQLKELEKRLCRETKK